MGSVFDEIIRTQKPSPPVSAGLIWVNILVRFDINGNAQILKSFTTPAKESTIKKFKPKKAEIKKSINIEESDNTENLF